MVETSEGRDNGIVRQHALRAAMIVTHCVDFGVIKGTYNYEKRYLKVLNQYPHLSYVMIVKC